VQDTIKFFIRLTQATKTDRKTTGSEQQQAFLKKLVKGECGDETFGEAGH